MQKQVFCAYTATARDVSEPILDLINDFGVLIREAFVLRTEAAFAALAAWEAHSEAAWGAWKARSEQA